MSCKLHKVSKGFRPMGSHAGQLIEVIFKLSVDQFLVLIDHRLRSIMKRSHNK